jgi:hypothetical protein
LVAPGLVSEPTFHDFPEAVARKRGGKHSLVGTMLVSFGKSSLYPIVFDCLIVHELCNLVRVDAQVFHQVEI